MKTRRELWMVALVVFLFILFIGVSTSVVIIRREGIDGLFRRKRAVVEQVRPEALPIQDKIEKAVRDRLPADSHPKDGAVKD
jgi:hypothetical protein